MDDQPQQPVRITALRVDGCDGVTATIRDDAGHLIQEVFAAPKTNALQTFPEVEEI